MTHGRFWYIRFASRHLSDRYYTCYDARDDERDKEIRTSVIILVIVIVDTEPSLGDHLQKDI